MKSDIINIIIWSISTIIWTFLTIFRYNDGSEPFVYILTGITAVLSFVNVIIRLIKISKIK